MGTSAQISLVPQSEDIKHSGGTSGRQMHSSPGLHGWKLFFVALQERPGAHEVFASQESKVSPPRGDCLEVVASWVDGDEKSIVSSEIGA